MGIFKLYRTSHNGSPLMNIEFEYTHTELSMYRGRQWCHWSLKDFNYYISDRISLIISAQMRTITISLFSRIHNMAKLTRNLKMELMDSGSFLTSDWPLKFRRSHLDNKLSIESFKIKLLFSWDTDVEHVTTMCDQLNENLDNLAFIMCTGDLGSFSKWHFVTTFSL